MLSSTGPPTAGPPVFVPDHVSAEANRLPDHEIVETLYRLGERDRIVGIFGGCACPPEAHREKPRVSAFTRQLRRRSLLSLADHVVHWKNQDDRPAHISGGGEHSGWR
jgi:hypothetical protein